MTPWRKVSFVILVLFVCSLFISPVFAQSPSDKPSFQTEESASGVGSAKRDQELLDEMNRKDPQKVEALDAKLSEALMLYYDGKYGQALPIFQEISTQLETTDVMWWIGTSAMNTGDLQLAIQKFRKMLDVDPSLQRVRLELAAAYFQLGRYDEAKRELETVKATNPPKEVEANIDRMLAVINEQQRKLTWNFRFALGYMYDSNVSAGPDNRILNAGAGATFTIPVDSAKVSDSAVVTSMAANVLYDFGDKQGFMWNTDLNLYSTAYTEYGKYNYFMTDVSTGLWWVGRQDIVKIPVGFLSQSLGGNFLDERLSDIVHFDPSYEHFFGKYFSLRGAFTYSREDYHKAYNNIFDNNTRRYEINPNFFFFNRQHILALTAGYEEVDADNYIDTTSAWARTYSYEGQYYGVSYFMRFPTKTEVFLKYQWSDRRFKSPPPQWWYPDSRIDRRNVATVVLSQGFAKHFFASFAFNYIDNKSNADLYTFDKQTYTVSLGVYF